MGPLLLKKFRIIQIPVIPISHLHFRQVSREGANLPTQPVFSRCLEYICIPDLHSRFGIFSSLVTNLVDKRCNSEFFIYSSGSYFLFSFPKILLLHSLSTIPVSGYPGVKFSNRKNIAHPNLSQWL